MNELPAWLTRINNRNKSGVGIIIIVFLLAFTVLFALGLFSFETHRVQVARDELRAACESAALAGAAALASSNETDPSNTHDLAETAAQQAFLQNTILGKLLSNTTFTNSKSSTASAALTANPGANQAVVYVEFQKEDGTTAAWTDPLGRIVNVVANYGEAPSFGVFMNLQKFNVNATAKGRVPLLDVVMCFDVSGSIDDQTRVSFVRRIWNATTNRIEYPIAVSGGTVGNGSIYELLRPSPTGCDVQAEPPQTLSQAGSLGRRYYFKPELRRGPGTTGGVGETGYPPGNFPAGTAYNADTFTDMVTNLDGKKVFAGFSEGGFSYPNVAVLVEASRGNLESDAVFTASKANTSPLLAGIVPKAGYQAHYWKMVKEKEMPIHAARLAAINFFRIMNNNTDARFGLVGFGNTGTGPATSPSNLNYNIARIDSSYAPGGAFQPPYPGQSFGNNNFNTIINDVIPKTIANGCTCMGPALDVAVNQLIAGKRPGAKAAVIMFTDGQPTCGGSWSSAATRAHDNGIAVYTVGLAQNAAIIPAECNNLNDDDQKDIHYIDPDTGAPGVFNPTMPGMAKVAGHDGKFFLVTDSTKLNFVFENIARQLTQLEKI